MNRDDAVKKIKKCLALAKSGNEAEAATALRQAHTLMREHGLDEQGIDLASVVEVEVQARFIPILLWETVLVGAIAEAFGCEVITADKLGARRTIRMWRLIGVGAAPEIAGYAFDVLASQCVRARRAHIGKQSKNCKPATKAARGDAFALGWVRGVQALIERFGGGGRNAELLEAYMAKRYPALTSAKVKRRDVGRNIRDDALQGRDAARSATLHRGVGSPLELKLIGA